MKAMVSLLVVVTLLGHALAQTYTVNEMRPAEAVKVASRLSVGTREEEAERFMATNGLKVAYSLTVSNGNDSLHYYFLKSDNHKLTLQFSRSAGKARTNRLLTTAWLTRGTNLEPELKIRLTKAPEAANAPSKAP